MSVPEHAHCCEIESASFGKSQSTTPSGFTAGYGRWGEFSISEGKNSLVEGKMKMPYYNAELGVLSKEPGDILEETTKKRNAAPFRYSGTQSPGLPVGGSVVKSLSLRFRLHKCRKICIFGFKLQGQARREFCPPAARLNLSMP